jgi:hypothetical protein
VTIAYPEGRPLDLQTIIGGWRPPCTTHVHYRYRCQHFTCHAAWVYTVYANKNTKSIKKKRQVPTQFSTVHSSVWISSLNFTPTLPLNRSIVIFLNFIMIYRNLVKAYLGHSGMWGLTNAPEQAAVKWAKRILLKTF